MRSTSRAHPPPDERAARLRRNYVSSHFTKNGKCVMGDIDEEIVEGPKVSAALEFGGTYDKPRTRDKYWYRAFLTETPRDEGLIWRVARRPRTRRGEDPHPTVRLMKENPAGMLFAKVKSGEILVENYYDHINRMILQEADEAKKGSKKSEKPSK
ncbi:hypothetical protein BWQ96_07106 [Gracilariopsis chorda]|uniref:Uncharacterized protein n=1 Tax=Gracilariopsis chorda TaxID=448386 RepID=A0A2V3IM44_9FLOR|nr:hypothetical protein BWQ96_07106 [Gracilariopsis chorda]|eukprot:PXF43162.1 hypothetical protein BWQ96_07106 [Gracilariopsis chorda]